MEFVFVFLYYVNFFTDSVSELYGQMTYVSSFGLIHFLYVFVPPLVYIFRVSVPDWLHYPTFLQAILLSLPIRVCIILAD
jgi:hypothetical protein